MARITKREMFVEVENVLNETGNTELAEFIAKQVALLEKRASKPRKATAEQLANEDTKAEMLAVLETSNGMDATSVGTVVGISVQKASQLLRQLIADGLVTKTPAKGKVKAQFAVTE